MGPLRNVPVPFLSLESTQLNSKSFPRTAESVRKMTFIQLVAGASRTASRRELLALLIHSRRGATILDIALLLSLV